MTTRTTKITVPADCELVTFTDSDIPAGERRTTVCCGDIIAQTNGPMTINTTCPTCGRRWTVERVAKR